MIDALNDLLHRLAERMETERRFTSDAAHELRTPISAIRAQAQVALGCDDNELMRHQALQNTLVGCDRVAHLVDQMLTLARVERPQDLTSEPFRLDQLLQQVMADLSPEALRRFQKLELVVTDNLQVRGQSTLWGILLRNLIDNALRYSPEGAMVNVHAHSLNEGRVEVTVQDNGPGLSQEALSRLGERFFRVLGTRSLGSGLGWSIVQHIAKLQNIDVQVSVPKEGGGLLVRLRW